MKKKLKVVFYAMLFLMMVVIVVGCLRLFGIYVVYSPTDSIKRGYWLFHDCSEEELSERGTYVQFPFQWDGIFKDANVSNYKFLIKEVIGLEGDMVKVSPGVVSVCPKGSESGACLEYERIYGVPFYNIEGLIKKGDVYVSGKTEHSFDSRYFGNIKKSIITRCGAPL